MSNVFKVVEQFSCLEKDSSSRGYLAAIAISIKCRKLSHSICGWVLPALKTDKARTYSIAFPV